MTCSPKSSKRHAQKFDRRLDEKLKRNAECPFKQLRCHCEENQSETIDQRAFVIRIFISKNFLDKLQKKYSPHVLGLMPSHLVGLEHNYLDPSAVAGDIRVELIVTDIADFFARVLGGHNAHSPVNSIVGDEHCAACVTCK